MTGFYSLVEQVSEKTTAKGQGYALTIPGDWCQGRTAFGGLTTGLSFAAARKRFPDLAPLRSCQITFVGPVSDQAVFVPTILRQGRNVTSVRVDVFCEDNIVATSVLIFAQARNSVLSQDKPAPEAAAPMDCENFKPEGSAGFLPAFIGNFDVRLAAGARPVTGADEGYIRVWARHSDPASRSGEGAFLAIGDVLPPAALPLLTQFGPVSSINWQVNIIRDPITDDGWWHLDTRMSAAKDGYSSQIMRYWNRKGELVAEAIQNVALFV